MSKYLLTEKLAIRNTNHLKALRQKCIAAGLLTPESSNDAVSNSENVGNEPKNLVNGHANCNNIGNGLVKKSCHIFVHNVRNYFKTRFLIEIQENNEATEDTVRNGDTIPSKTSLFKKPDRPAPVNVLFIVIRVFELKIVAELYVLQKRKNKCVENEGIKPLVYWWQDNTSITLTIRKNVNEDYTITHDGRRRICFQSVTSSEYMTHKKVELFFLIFKIVFIGEQRVTLCINSTKPYLHVSLVKRYTITKVG